MRTGSL